MTKIAILGSIHVDGWSILEKNSCDVFEITDFSSDNLIEKLQDIDGIALRTAKLTENILKQLNAQLHEHLNSEGMHKSINPCTHAEYINDLYEIKNMCLYFNKKIRTSIFWR